MLLVTPLLKIWKPIKNIKINLQSHSEKQKTQTLYADKFIQASNDIKSTWNLINELLNRKKNLRPLHQLRC